MTNTAYATARRCHCGRCRARGLVGPAILITLGVLFLLQELYIVRFDQSWPVLLLVIGAMIFLSRSASAEGHLAGTYDNCGAPLTAPQPGVPVQQNYTSEQQPAPPQTDDREVKS